MPTCPTCGSTVKQKKFPNSQALYRAEKKAGGTSALARELGMSNPQSITNWKRRESIPGKHLARLKEIASA